MGKQKFGFTTQFFCACCDESIDYFHELQNDAKHIFPQCNKFNFYQEIKGSYGILAQTECTWIDFATKAICRLNLPHLHQSPL